MPPPLRFAPPGAPLHVWCRGNQRQNIFFSDLDRERYLALLVRHTKEHGVGILAYCLMSNHVHLVLQPSTADGLTRSMMRVNSEYAQTMQFKLGRCGHFWQGRFKSAVMDDSYLWRVFRYVELNPVRAGIARRAQEWKWSSAGAHLGLATWPVWLVRDPFCSAFTTDEWHSALETTVDAETQATIEMATRQCRPLARVAQVKTWEREFNVRLSPGLAGRPPKPGELRSRDRRLAATASD